MTYPEVRLLLVGLMGSGKTSVGQALSHRLGWPLVDNDAEIALLAGRSTLELSHEGGNTLHEWESRYTYSLLERQPPFIAGLAGSTGDRPEELVAAHDRSLLVYLRCSVDALVKRVTADDPRPWLEHLDVRAFVQQTSDQRDDVFRSHADVVVDGDAPLDSVVQQVLDALGAVR